MGVDVGTLNMTAPTNATRASGLSVSGSFVGNNNLNPNDIVMWVQLITTNQPYGGQPASPAYYFDPAPSDPVNTNYVTLNANGTHTATARALQYPFYWNVAEANQTATQQSYNYTNYQTVNAVTSNRNAVFSDSPQRARTPNAVWDAELDLVCWNPTTNALGMLWSGTYGFSTGANMLTSAIRGITQNGTVNGANYSGPTPVALTAAALTAAGFNNNAAVPGNNWSITSACNCVVPEPAVIYSLLSGAFMLIVVGLCSKPKGHIAQAPNTLAA
jgi:hypothetical protein